jgi:hypothetical protein
MKIFGNILPFIGFITLPMDNEGAPTSIANAHFEADCFVLEWFNEGIVLFGGDLRARQRG